MNKVLEVKNLKIAFRTNGGTLKAVRDISFDLEKGKTLAIVGESGSGKSVTSKAILGILAGNSIVEGGEILYDGKDLLKIGEDEMCKIRGDKISMIFQDPLSSLNPIVKIGKQITEAMLLKNKANRKEARQEFSRILALLKKNMEAACGEDERGLVSELADTFTKVSAAGSRLEQGYNAAVNAASELAADIDEFLFQIEKKQKTDAGRSIRELSGHLSAVKNPILTNGYDSRLQELAAELSKATTEVSEELERTLRGGKDLLEEIASQERPNFYEIGFFRVKNEDAPLPGRGEYGKAAEQFEREFMSRFTELAKKGLRASSEEALAKKSRPYRNRNAKKFFSASFRKADAQKFAKTLSDQIEDSIDRMEIVKDSKAYTFRSSLNHLIEKYFFYEAKNPKEEARFARQTKKREALIARGKEADWKVVPKVTMDLEELRKEILLLIGQLQEHYEMYLASAGEIDFHSRALELIAFLQEKSSQSIYRVTKRMAKEKAIRLMEEVRSTNPAPAMASIRLNFPAVCGSVS